METRHKDSDQKLQRSSSNAPAQMGRRNNSEASNNGTAPRAVARQRFPVQEFHALVGDTRPDSEVGIALRALRDVRKSFARSHGRQKKLVEKNFEKIWDKFNNLFCQYWTSLHPDKTPMQCPVPFLLCKDTDRNQVKGFIARRDQVYTTSKSSKTLYVKGNQEELFIDFFGRQQASSIANTTVPPMEPGVGPTVATLPIANPHPSTPVVTTSKATTTRETDTDLLLAGSTGTFELEDSDWTAVFSETPHKEGRDEELDAKRSRWEAETELIKVYKKQAESTAVFELLKQRQELIKLGVDKKEIDELLPLPKKAPPPTSTPPSPPNTFL